MLFVHCDCGETVQAETEDEIVSAVQEHARTKHDGLEMSREQILEMAHEH